MVKIVPSLWKVFSKWHSQLFFLGLLLFCHNIWIIFSPAEANSALKFLLPEVGEERPQPHWLISEGLLVSANTLLDGS